MREGMALRQRDMKATEWPCSLSVSPSEQTPRWEEEQHEGVVHHPCGVELTLSR